MIGAPKSLNLNCKVRVTKEAPGPSVSEEIADIFINYDIDYKVWDEITYPFLNFKGCTVEASKWMSNVIPHFTRHVITYQCWD